MEGLHIGFLLQRGNGHGAVLFESPSDRILGQLDVLRNASPPGALGVQVFCVRSEAVAPRAYWKGYLKLSLVSCPIAIYPASSEREKISFHQVNKKTGNRVKYRKVDSETGHEVDTDDIVKGYEVSKGQYIELDPDELDAIAIESKRMADEGNGCEKQRDADRGRNIQLAELVAADREAGANSPGHVRASR
jgi:hypothetical protein